ncbi:MAG: cytochrome c maturation protein CcmE [Candidatus Binataceae bacterium]
MRFRPRFFIGAALIVAAIGYLIVSAIGSTSEYYLTVNEAAAREPQLESAGRALRVAGRVKAAGIAWDPDTLTLKFNLGPIPAPGAARVESAAAASPLAKVALSDPPPLFHVICVGNPKPDMFAPGRHVIVEGKLARGGVIDATQVLTSCPSKYQAKPGQ